MGVIYLYTICCEHLLCLIPFRRQDQSCKSLKPLVYAKCGPVDVDQTVNTTVDIFRKSVKCLEEGLYHGELILSFFDKRETKEYLGFVTKHENVYFEKWKISIELTDSRYQRLKSNFCI